MALLLRLRGGGGEAGLVAVRPDGFSWCGRELWASTPHASVLCNRKNTGDHFQMKMHMCTVQARALHYIDGGDKQNKHLTLQYKTDVCADLITTLGPDVCMI